MATLKFATSLCIIIGLSTGVSRSESARQVEFCDLAPQAAEYADQLIEVTAEISFSYHAALLLDSRCEFGVTVWFPTDEAVHPDVDKLRDLRLSSMSGATRIFGKFRGRFRNNTKQDPPKFFEGGIPFMLLELEAVSNIRTTTK